MDDSSHIPVSCQVFVQVLYSNVMQVTSPGVMADAVARLLGAIRRYDEAAVHAVLDERLARSVRLGGGPT